MYDRESYQVIGACIAVHKALGPGLLESAYEECLAAQFEDTGIPFERQVPITLRYRGRVVPKAYFADFVAFGLIVVELKSIWEIKEIHAKQLRTYVRAANLPVGLLINFNAKLIDKHAICRVDHESL